jgi:hypothetical protein
MVSGWIGILLALGGFSNLLQSGNERHDALSILMPVLLLFLGIYYIASAMRDKRKEKPNKWAP